MVVYQVESDKIPLKYGCLFTGKYALQRAIRFAMKYIYDDMYIRKYTDNDDAGIIICTFKIRRNYEAM